MELRVGGKYRLSRKLGSGAFGDIYHGRSRGGTGLTRRRDKYQDRRGGGHKARKSIFTTPPRSPRGLSTRSSSTRQRSTSSSRAAVSTSAFIERIVGIPTIHWWGLEGDFNILVMDLLGASLEDLFAFMKRRFSLKTILILADQMVDSFSRAMIVAKTGIHAQQELHPPRRQA